MLSSVVDYDDDMLNWLIILLPQECFVVRCTTPSSSGPDEKKMLYGTDRRKYEGVLKRVCARSVG